MADTKISDLPSLATAAGDDLLPIVDASATQTKSIEVRALGEMRVAEVTTDLNTGTNQLLYTVPTGKKFLLTQTVLRSASVSLATGDISVVTVQSPEAASEATTVHDLSLHTLGKIDLQSVAAGLYTPLSAGETLTLAKVDPFGSPATVVIEIFGILF